MTQLINASVVDSDIATQAELDGVASTVAGINKAYVGLGNVDNTSDVNKPVSTATTSAIGAAVSGITKTSLGLGNVDNTSDADKPISTLTSTALSGKQATLVSATNIKTINGASVLGSGDLVVSGGGGGGVLSKQEEPTSTVTGLVDRRHHLNAAATTVTAPASADGAKFGVNPMGQTDCFINWGAASLITPGGTFTGTYALNLGLSEDYEFSSTSNKWSSI